MYSLKAKLISTKLQHVIYILIFEVVVPSVQKGMDHHPRYGNIFLIYSEFLLKMYLKLPLVVTTKGFCVDKVDIDKTDVKSTLHILIRFDE